MSEKHTTANRPARTILLLCLVIPVLVALPVGAFSWAAAGGEPHELPLGIAGPEAATAPVQEQLATQGDAFDVHTFRTAEAARTAIEDREIYGAVVATPQGLEVLTASAASPAVAQMLTETFAKPQAGTGQSPATVQDVVPADADDPRGTALGASVLPLVIVSVLAGLLVLALTAPGWGQLLGVVSAAALGGLTVIAIVQGWLGALGGDWVLNASVVGLVIGAISACVVGFSAAFGRAGLVVAAPLMIFLGNPWSGMTSAPELLPQPAGLIGSLLPPGAGGNLLRSTAFFDGAGATPYLLVLLGWALLGVIGILIGAVRRRNATVMLADTARPLVAAVDSGRS